MGCATGTIKYSLFLLNMLWAILGILVILFGGLGWGAMPQSYAIGIICLGGVILFISFFGCFGTIRESTRLLWTYAICLLVLLVLIVVFICLSSRDVFKRYAMEGVEAQWRKELMQPGSMDTVQMVYACCGLNSAEDYIRIARAPPASCCNDGNCINPLNLHLTGCLPKVEEAFVDEAILTTYYEYGLLGFDFLILLLTVILAIHYQNRKRRFSY
ncbi:PREDICTED: protein late bloomer [Rhagoletis zephyria]|uniref:protein late bloomer n=1 Tax=Rhagoletis zephyria TaxID=28612 RepID=UPI000811667C|nr:PREDICTED: protein late bloomer [Rhagoletis zephyria]XP_017472877.1 PREDICTED: protein late bloomer [Rhagoletis zephyria]XP_017472879.1 PREDICTED: protein late bloomer [Rhagoletis zephyria]XP_017472880.1 PREDICTED: protein late bloomer [Rhagoletis zephyria]